MKVLITGATGYIGSHTVVEFLQNGYDVVAADSCVRSSAATIDRIEAITGRRPPFYRVDLTNGDAVAAIYAEHPDIEAILHFAAFKAVGESVSNPLLYYSNNLTSVINLLQHAPAPMKSFVFSSSCTVYGEPDSIPVTEKTPIKPAESPYGATKQMSERIITDYIRAAGGARQACFLRYFNPAGAHPSLLIGEDASLPLASNLVPIIVSTVVGRRKDPLKIFGTDYPTRDGTCIRDFIHVCDIATAHRLALEYMLSKQTDPISVFNLGAGNGITVKEAVAEFESVNGIAVPHVYTDRRPGDVSAIYANNEFARETLGWNIRFNLGDIMKTAWEYEKRQHK
jgi:UDP-glucose 4-epimerase